MYIAITHVHIIGHKHVYEISSSGKAARNPADIQTVVGNTGETLVRGFIRALVKLKPRDAQQDDESALRALRSEIRVSAFACTKKKKKRTREKSLMRDR